MQIRVARVSRMSAAFPPRRSALKEAYRIRLYALETHVIVIDGFIMKSNDIDADLMKLPGYRALSAS